MTQQKDEKRTRQQNEPQGQDGTTREELRDEREGPGVERNEQLKGSQRLPRKGNEMDKPDSDRLGE